MKYDQPQRFIYLEPAELLCPRSSHHHHRSHSRSRRRRPPARFTVYSLELKANIFCSCAYSAGAEGGTLGQREGIVHDKKRVGALVAGTRRRLKVAMLKYSATCQRALGEFCIVNNFVHVYIHTPPSLPLSLSLSLLYYRLLHCTTLQYKYSIPPQ